MESGALQRKMIIIKQNEIIDSKIRKKLTKYVQIMKITHCL